ncbi:hypothetical protein [Exiguobacterium sp. AB2]|uniref:hypothetical protein n=1 Tax=Exiguobacterium sp. AB2 TaxID=1484479 RepID=UPI000A815DAD|nr:hypothetical protein [Exiguobacterium sp. AB2]
MITLTYIFGAWALYLLGYAVGKARGYEDGMHGATHLIETYRITDAQAAARELEGRD